jgi:AraC-like DNA-binding protein
MDIVKQQPYIQKLIAVVKNSMVRTPRKRFVNGRLSDAFVYVLSGGCEYHFENGMRFTVESGDVLYLANQAIYEMKLQTERYSFIYVDFLFEGEEKRQSAVYKNASVGDMAGDFKKLYTEYRKLKSSMKISCIRQLYEIYERLCERNEQIYVPSSLKEKMENCEAYIRTHYWDNELNIDYLASLAQMSAVYFRKSFQAVYKTSPKKYLTHIRLEQACQWMKYPFLRLEECAELCGFSSWQYFSKVFKNEMGETPAVYRKNLFPKDKN